MGGLALALASLAWSYDLIRDSNGYIQPWGGHTVAIKNMLPTSPGLSDGYSQNGSVQAAMQVWNANLNAADIQFTPTIAAPGAYGVGNGVNEIVMDSTMDGEAFGQGVLAVTIGNGSQADIIFNSAYTWDSYRGALRRDGVGQLVPDMQRVAIHELGHLLGLNHPDQASPVQSVTAIMNSQISNLDALAADDIAGGQVLYGTAGVTPANDYFSSAIAITLTNASALATGSSVAAAKEFGEPNHAGNSGGRSVWWKWRSPGAGSLSVSTANSNFDTTLSIYVGDDVTALSQIASNDDVDPGIIRSSALTCVVTSGTTYYIAVDGWNGASGLIFLELILDSGSSGVGPSFSNHPVNQSVIEGGRAQYSVFATGTPTPSYKWQRMPAGSEVWANLSDGGVYSGANTLNLTLNAVTASMNGDQFRCVASNPSGTVQSDAATLTVTPPIVFASHPLTRLLMAGETAMFQVSATGGSGVLSYQWRRNGKVLNGETGSTLSLANVTSVDDGFYEVVVADANGAAHTTFRVHVASPGLTVAGWGDNQYGQLRSPIGLNSIVAIASGFPQTLALKADGTVVVWGDSSGYHTVPAGLNGVVAIAASRNNAALKADGTVVVWGLNTTGQIDVPVGLNEVVAIAMGQNQCVALKANGKIVTWGDGASSYTHITNVLDSIVAVAAGAQHGMALKADGTVVTWGENSSGGSVVPPSGLNGVVAISAWGGHCLALKSNGEVVAWGSNASGEATVPGNASPAVAIAAGSEHSLALKSDGTVVGWGNNSYGQTQAPGWIGAVQSISAGGTSSMGLVLPVAPAITSQPSGQEVNSGGYLNLNVAVTAVPNPVYQWRRNGVNLTDGQRIAGSNTNSLDLSGVQSSEAGNYDVVISNIAGTVTSQTAVIAVRMPPQAVAPPLSRLVGIGQSVTFDATAQGDVTYAWSHEGRQLADTGASLTLTSVSAADAGRYVVTMTNSVGSTKAVFYLRVPSANFIYAWGDNVFGQAVVPAGLKNIAGLSAGMAHNLALRADGTVVAWGRNDGGQSDVPAGLNNVVQVSAGSYHSVALKADGTVIAWGANDSGQSDVPAGLGGVVFVSAGGSHTVALKSDGTLAAWGANTYGQTTVPADIRFTYFVSAGLSHNVALTDGRMTAWGKNDFGQSTLGNVFSAIAAQAGADHTLYIDSRGALLAQGIATYVPSVTGATSISVRETHGILLKETGEIIAWGPGFDGENDVPAGVGNGQMVAAGAGHSVVAVTPIAPAIQAQPVSVSSVVSENISFSVTAVGAATYRWFRNDIELQDEGRYSGSGTAILRIDNVNLSDMGRYTVRLTNDFGSAISLEATLHVQSLLVTNNGGAALNEDGTQVQLSVTASGGNLFTYQWFAGLSGDTSYPITGANTSILTVSQGSGQDYYWVRVSNGVQSVDSESIPIGKWKQVDPLFGSAELSSIAYGAGKYVVVGTAVGYSANAIEWKKGVIEAGADLHVVMFDGVRFIAGGVRGQVFVSENGITWQKLRAADPGEYANDALTVGATGNGIAVMASGNLMSSVNGIDWQWRSLGEGGTSIVVRSVAFGAGRFVAVGESSSSQHRIYQSTDGINWSPGSYTLTPFSNSYALNGLSQVVYLGGRFIALGQLQYSGNRAYYMTSTDGLNWTVPAFTNSEVSLQHLASGDGVLLSADLRSSADGVNWSAPSPSPTNYSGGLGYGNGVFLVLGSRYNVGYSSISTSTDLSNWTRRVGFGIPKNIGYGNGRFVAVNRKTTGYSLDGLSWIFSLNTGNTDYLGLAYGNGLFVSLALSVDGISHFTSPDGITWTPRYSMVNGYRLPLGAVQYSGGQWVGFNSGGIYTSADALEWTLRYASSVLTIRDLAYGDGRYVAVCYDGGTLVSTDGVSWTRKTSHPFLKITYGLGLFVATDGGGLWTSTDGLQWISRPLPFKDAGGYVGSISSIEFGGGRFMASYGNDILSSSDGISWQVTPGALRDRMNQSAAVEKLIYGAGTFWAVAPASSEASSLLRAPVGQGQPEVVSTPSNVVIMSGGTATLEIAVSGAGLNYQWFEGVSGDIRQPIVGATSPSFTTPNLTQTTNYWVRVTGAGGTVFSTTVTVAISMAPTITLQPIDIDIISGLTANLSVVANGTPAPSYQWYAGMVGDTSNPIANATAGSLTVSALTVPVSYWARVSNSAGSVDSTLATITPWFERTGIKGRSLVGVAHGRDRWVVGGFGSNDYYSTTDGTSWTVTSTAFGGQSGGAITYGNGVFIAVDTDSIGALWRSGDGSIWQKIYVPGARVQFTQVACAGGLLFAMGSGGEFATSIDGSNWALQTVGSSAWLYDVAYGNGVFVIAAGTKTYISPNLVTWTEFPVSNPDALIISLAFGAGKFVGVGGINQGKVMTSATGSDWTQRYIYDSNGVYDVAYDGARFAVSASGHMILSRDGVAWRLGVFSGTSQVAADEGSFLAVGSSAAWQSARALRMGPIIMSQPRSQGLVPGQSVALNVSATGDSLSYQWRRNDVDIPDANSAVLTITNFQIGDAGSYSVVVTDNGGMVISDYAMLTAVFPPQLLAQPQSVTVNAGQSVVFEVSIAGNAAAQFAWYKDGVLISGKTDARLTIAAAQPNDAGGYYVIVANAAGSVMSDSATLVVRVPPVITQQPIDQRTSLGTSVSFTVLANSDTMLSYIWQRSVGGVGVWSSIPDDPSYSGQFTRTLTIASPIPVNSGDQYRCIIVNAAGGVTSNPATLTVGAAGFTKLSAGRYHSARVNTLAQLYAMGRNAQGQLGLGHTSDVTTAQSVTLAGKTITDVSAGAEHTLFLTSAKEVWAAGLNTTGQLGDGTTVSKSTPVRLATNAIGIAAGNFHSVVLKVDGTLWTVGGNDSGQLGNGTTTDTTVLGQVASGVVHAVAGIRQTLFLKSDGTLWAMGNLDGSESFMATPTQIASNVKTMAAGGYHNLFVKTDGTLWAMGYNPYGQLGTGDTTTRTTPVQVDTGVESVTAGYFYSLYLKTDRNLWAMGYNSFGQLGDGSTTTRPATFQMATNVTAMSASESYTLYTRTDGSLWATGLNGNGQFGNGGTATVTSPVQLASGVVLVPAAPAGLTVTQAADRVQLTWQPQGSATTFEVWRHTTNDPASATRMAQGQRWAIYEDLAVTPGQGYYYWVKAVNSAGTSGLSAVATTVSVQSQTITFNPLPDVAYTATPIVLSATASSGLNVTFSVVSGLASVTGSNLTLTGVGQVTVRANQTGDTNYYAATPVERSFTVTANFESWVQANFTEPERADASVSGPSAIYGQDGLPNLVKYALGLDPKVNATNGLPAVTTTATDWVYTYTKPVSVLDVSYAVEVSTNLSSWTTSGVTLSLVSTVSGVETWEAKYPLNSGVNAFFRLRITE